MEMSETHKTNHTFVRCFLNLQNLNEEYSCMEVEKVTKRKISVSF